jgi:predicted RNA-binding protein YlqC (UPF0109 family)
MPPLALVLGYIAVKNLHDTHDKRRVLGRLGYGAAAIKTIVDVSK